MLLPGDANNDGVVDRLDFIAVEKNFGATGPANGLLIGDANDDGRVDGRDLLAVERQFRNTLTASDSAPEPATLVACVFLPGLIGRRTSREMRFVPCGTIT